MSNQLIKTNKINHVGIILDGNRRYAKTLGLKSKEGHKKGIDNLEKLFNSKAKQCMVLNRILHQ